MGYIGYIPDLYRNCCGFDGFSQGIQRVFRGFSERGKFVRKYYIKTFASSLLSTSRLFYFNIINRKSKVVFF